jgi:hypothetical protein
MNKALLLASVALLLSCGGRIKDTSANEEQAPTSEDPGAAGANGSTTGAGSSFGAGSGAGSGGGGNAGGGSSSGAGGGTSGTGSGLDATSLTQGQCEMQVSGAWSFPLTTGYGQGVLGAGPKAAFLSCEIVMAPYTYRLVLVPTRDPDVPTTLVAHAQLFRFVYDHDAPVGEGSCTLTPVQDDATTYRASFDCSWPVADAYGTQITGAIDASPLVGDTLASPARTALPLLRAAPAPRLREAWRR